jgi:hypothetical protein
MSDGTGKKYDISQLPYPVAGLYSNLVNYLLDVRSTNYLYANPNS